MLKPRSPQNSFRMAASSENTCRNNLTRLVLAGALEKILWFYYGNTKVKTGSYIKFLIDNIPKNSYKPFHIIVMKFTLISKKNLSVQSFFVTLKKCFNSHIAKPEHHKIS